MDNFITGLEYGLGVGVAGLITVIAFFIFLIIVDVMSN